MYCSPYLYLLLKPLPMTNRNVLYWSFVVALGGFLFGFDTAVISGAERAIQQLWHLTATEHGFTVSIASEVDRAALKMVLELVGEIGR